MSYVFKSRGHYLSVAKQMKAYEDNLYEMWKANTEMVLPVLLKHNLLVKPQDRAQTSHEADHPITPPALESQKESDGKYTVDNCVTNNYAFEKLLFSNIHQ